MIGGMLRVLVIGLVLLVAVMFMLPRLPDPAPPPEAATVFDAPEALPKVQLVDQAGRPFSIEDLEGRYSLVFFGFTNCPDICPLTLQVLASAKRDLEQRGVEPPRLVFVSVDPARDAPERIRDYVGAFDADFVGVTAEEERLQPLLDALHVTVHKEEVDGERYNVVHNGTVYVLNEDADWIALFSGTQDAATIASDYERIRRGAQATAQHAESNRAAP